MGNGLDTKQEIKDFIDEISLAWRGGWWNYRVIEKGSEDYKYYEIHEVYYDADGKIIAWTENPVDLHIEAVADIKFLMKRFKKAAKKPILRIEDEELVDTGKYLKKR
jgi:hypothetical protein